MGGRSEMEFVGFVEHRRENFRREYRWRTEDLESVGAFLRDELHEFASLFGCVDRAAVPRTLAREDVRDEARRDDLVFRAAVALMETPVDAVATSRLAHGGDAVRHP